MHFSAPLGDHCTTLGAKHETELDGYLICSHGVQLGSYRGDARLDLIDRGFHRLLGVGHHLPGTQAGRWHQAVRQIILVHLDEQAAATHYRDFHYIRHRSHHGESCPPDKESPATFTALEQTAAISGDTGQFPPGKG